MKLRFPILAIIVAALVVVSCRKNQPAYQVEGTYTGFFDGTFEGVSTSVSTGYTVVATAMDKNSVRIEGTDFETFTALVTENGINVQLVNDSETITEFLYLGDENKLQFTYSKDGNTASFIGTKPE
ncbi:MAG: hypothetical protein MK078_08310 [Crocinitomicaceae bacterium]|nr:hypothetical protein [Crocinitomicaceae bacterium]